MIKKIKIYVVLKDKFGGFWGCPVFSIFENICNVFEMYIRHSGKANYTFKYV